MDQPTLAILLLILSLFFIVAEIFLPSGGLLTALAVMSLAGSFWCAHNAWWEDSPGKFLSYLVSGFVLIPATIVFSFYLLPRTRFGKAAMATAPKEEDVRPFVEEEAHLQSLVGRFGETLTPLNPGGLVTLDGERLHAESEGMMLERAERIKVIAIHGNRVVVRRTDEPEPTLEPTTNETSPIELARDEHDPPIEPPSNAPLDFDLPQG